MIEIKHLNVKYNGKVILDDINTVVGDGEFVGILGPNGAGKTTLIKTILGLTEIFEGEVKINGFSPKHLNKKKYRISYLPQHSIVNWTMPLRVIDIVLIEKLKLFSIFRKYSKEDLEKAYYWLDIFGVLNLKEKHVKELSSGQQQRVSLARCMFYNPQMLVLDEPNTAVDVVYNVKMYSVLSELKSKRNMIIIMASHDIGAITEYVDRVMCLNVKLYCHEEPKKVNYNKILYTLYGNSMDIVVHKHKCDGCIIKKRVLK